MDFKNFLPTPDFKYFSRFYYSSNQGRPMLKIILFVFSKFIPDLKFYFSSFISIYQIIT